MTAEQGARLVAQFVDSSYPADQEKIFSILKLAINRAWKEGKWRGMSAEMFVKIFIDSNGEKYVTSPHGYGALLAVNVDGKPRPMRNNYFMFHRNGYGDIKDHKLCEWNQDVYDLGDRPTIIDIETKFPDGAIIGARNLSKPGSKPEKINIQGESEGIPLFTFEKGQVETGCNCVQVSSEEIRTVSGVELNITNDLNYVGNVDFKNITAIHKTHTSGIVEVYAFDVNTGKGCMISRMMPWERESSFKRYKIPSGCNDTIHGLYKVDRQPDIIDGSQKLIISDEEAIISLAKGVYLIYHKDNIAGGQAFILQGINALEKEQREEESPTEFPIQFTGMGSDDVPQILNYY